MKVALYSDIHLEVDAQHGRKPWQPPELDLAPVLLAGDIASHTPGSNGQRKRFRGGAVHQVAYLAGNHEYYAAGRIAQAGV